MGGEEEDKVKMTEQDGEWPSLFSLPSARCLGIIERPNHSPHRRGRRGNSLSDSRKALRDGDRRRMEGKRRRHVEVEHEGVGRAGPEAG